MPGIASFSWGSWNNTAIDGTATIATTANTSTAPINNDGKVATEVSVSVTYGIGVAEGVVVRILRMTSSTDYESTGDGGFALQLPVAASTTYRKSFVVPASDVSRFKINVENNTGSNLMPTVKYRQATIEVA